MNERIKELAEQAGWPKDTHQDDMYQIVGPDFTKKFAELMLKDIDTIIDNLYHAMPLEQAAVLLVLDENIKEHFYGVEE